MHTLQSLVSELTAMEHAINNLGFQAADSDLNLHWSHGNPLHISLTYIANGAPLGFYETRQEETDEALSALITAAWDHIRNLKTPEQLAKEAFMLKFGRIIDEARELDLPVEFLNPLEESMRQLSTNILEDHS